jgi:hypothetical protein
MASISGAAAASITAGSVVGLQTPRLMSAFGGKAEIAPRWPHIRF